MARGFLSGILTGGFVSVLGLGTVSLLGEQPAGNAPPETPQVVAPDAADVASVTPAEPSEPSLTGPGEGDGPSLGPAPDVDVPGDDGALPVADTAVPEMPEGGIVEGEMETPVEGEDAGVALESDAPVLPSPLAAAPETPLAENDIVLSTDPAQEPEPIVVEDAAVAPTQEEPEDFFVTDTNGDTAAAPADAPVIVELTDTPADKGTDEAPKETTPDAQASAQDAPTSAEDAEAPSAEEEASAVADAGAHATPRLQLQGGENSLLTDRGTGVTIRRPGSAQPEAEAVLSEIATDPAAMDVPALEAYSTPVENPNNLPLMSVVLVDDGMMPAAKAALAGLPFPVTIAIDPSQQGAASLAQSYRDAGFEVVVLAHLPDGAVPSDVEVTFQAIFNDLPESIAVLDLGEAGFQQNRDATEQAMDILAADGRGYVTVSQGLNTASRAAEQAGVPAAVVYRDLDSEGQEARVIRRFVDQAAFRARQESGVVLVGRIRPDTLSALILWGTANRAGQVALVPVSAVLTAEE